MEQMKRTVRRKISNKNKHSKEAVTRQMPIGLVSLFQGGKLYDYST